MTEDWYATVDLVPKEPLAPDIEGEILAALEDYAAGAMSVSEDRMYASISLTVDAAGALAAGSRLRSPLSAVEKLIGPFEVVALDVKDEARKEAELDAPLFPEVVGYSEIAEMAGVTRQRARALAGKEGFPAPVIETKAGPLMRKAAVEAWLEHWDRSTGRPRKPKPTDPDYYDGAAELL